MSLKDVLAAYIDDFNRGAFRQGLRDGRMPIMSRGDNYVRRGWGIVGRASVCRVLKAEHQQEPSGGGDSEGVALQV